MPVLRDIGTGVPAHAPDPPAREEPLRALGARGFAPGESEREKAISRSPKETQSLELRRLARARALRARRRGGLGLEDRSEAELPKPPSRPRSRARDHAPALLLHDPPRSVESDLGDQPHARDAARWVLAPTEKDVVPREARAPAVGAPRGVLRVEELRATALQRRSRVSRADREAHGSAVERDRARALEARSRQGVDRVASRPPARGVKCHRSTVADQFHQFPNSELSSSFTDGPSGNSNFASCRAIRPRRGGRFPE